MKWRPIMTIEEAAYYPWGHGAAYDIWDPVTMECRGVRTAVIPLNLVLALLRLAGWRLYGGWLRGANYLAAHTVYRRIRDTKGKS